MEDDLTAANGMEGALVALYVSLDDLDVGRKSLEVRAAPGRKVVENRDLVAEADKALGQVRSDESAAARYEYASTAGDRATSVAFAVLWSWRQYSRVATLARDDLGASGGTGSHSGGDAPLQGRCGFSTGSAVAQANFEADRVPDRSSRTRETRPEHGYRGRETPGWPTEH